MEEIAPPSANESVFAATSSGSLSITDLMSSLKDTTGYRFVIIITLKIRRKF